MENNEFFTQRDLSREDYTKHRIAFLAGIYTCPSCGVYSHATQWEYHFEPLSHAEMDTDKDSSIVCPSCGASFVSPVAHVSIESILLAWHDEEHTE